MTRTEKGQDDWTQARGSFRGPLGVVAAGAALLYHVASLRWFRAPKWKNKEEALAELRRVVSQNEGNDYAFWVKRIDLTKGLEFSSRSGTWYQTTIEPVWDDAPGGAIRVLFALDDGGVGAYHPLTMSLLVGPPVVARPRD